MSTGPEVPDADLVLLSVLQRRPTRPISASHVAALAESMGEVGLIHPIWIDIDRNVHAGEHRIQAAELLGWDQIPAVVKTLDDARAELAALDENLVRNEGTTLWRAEALARRKEIYEGLHPETKHGGARPGAGRKSSGPDGQLKQEPPAAPRRAPSFVEDTAAKTGISERSLRRHTGVVERLDPKAKAAIAETPIADSITALEGLAQLEPEAQREVAEEVAELPREEQLPAAKEKLRRKNPHAASNVNAGPEKNDRFTGMELIEELHREFHFTVDACGHPKAPASKLIGKFYTREDDARTKDFTGETPFFNVPFDELEFWLGFTIDLITSGKVKRAVHVMPASRTEQDLWQKFIELYRPDRKGSGVRTRFLRGNSYRGDLRQESRTRYGNPQDPLGKKSGSPNFASVVVIFEGPLRRSPEMPAAADASGPTTAAERYAAGAPGHGLLLGPSELEGPAHQWQRENPLSAPDRALYRCLLCDLKHRGQDALPPFGPCKPKEFSLARGYKTPAKEVTWWLLSTEEGDQLSHAYPGRDANYTGPEVSDARRALCGIERPSPERPGDKGDLDCPTCLAEARKRKATPVPATAWTVEWRRKGKAGMAHAYGDPLLKGRSSCGRPAEKRPNVVTKLKGADLHHECIESVAVQVAAERAMDPLHTAAAVPSDEPACVGCGCTENRACPPGKDGKTCHWAISPADVGEVGEGPLCSRCAKPAKRPETSDEIAELLMGESVAARTAALRDAGNKLVRIRGERKPPRKVRGKTKDRCDACGQHREDIEHLVLNIQYGRGKSPTGGSASGSDLCPPCQTPAGMRRAEEHRRSGQATRWFEEDRAVVDPEADAPAPGGKRLKKMLRSAGAPSKKTAGPLPLGLLQARLVAIRAGSFRDGRGGGGRCEALSQRGWPAHPTRCACAGMAVVKTKAGKLLSVCRTHGQMAMRDRVLRVAVEG